MKRFGRFSETSALMLASFSLLAPLASTVVPVRADPLMIQECDKLAERKVGAALNASGVPMAKLDAKSAARACEAAVRSDPTNAKMMQQLGRAYEKAEKWSDALKYYRQAATAGYAPAYGSLGYLYSTGSGVEKSERIAFEWFRTGAEAGDLASQITLGQIYESGRGVSQDYGEALRWFRKAADRGLAEGQDSVGYFHLTGIGVEKDEVQAAKWIQRAAEQGLASAENNLGAMYKAGRGVPKDLKQAEFWLRRAAAHGEESAKRILDAESARTGTKDGPYREANPKSSARTLIARSTGVVPGTIVCPDLQTVAVMFRLSAGHWEEKSQDAVTRGQSELLRGKAVPAPDLASFGCALIAPGTAMTLEAEKPVPIVSVRLPDGTIFRGVTFLGFAMGGSSPGLFSLDR